MASSLRPSTGLSLAQQIAQLEDVAPVDFDPEDIQVTGVDPDSDDKTETDKNAARAHYIDVGLSALRTLDSLSDPKYDGVKTSRNALLGHFDDDNSESNSEDEEDLASVDEREEEEDQPPVSDEENESDNETKTRISQNLPTNRPNILEPNDDLTSTLRKTREEDRKKGKAISRQIAVWDSLLDARIRLQKSVAAGNRLPSLSLDVADQDVQASLTKMLEEARLLSNEIFDFQERLLSANESTQPPPRKRRKAVDHDYSVTEYAEELREASHAASQLESTFHPHLVQTLDKWSSKIQAVAPSVLLPSNRNAFSKSQQRLKSATELIDETLADHSKVLARTRVYRGKGNRLGINAADEDEADNEDPEVFDDTDFYHQLLRDVIDSRGNNANEDWMALQKQKKAKKKVDTKASKGRKLRYEVHEKIQNFMVPVPMQGSWHEEQIDELFASLLGKGYESAMQEVGEVATDDTMQEVVTAALQGSFRVFG